MNNQKQTFLDNEANMWFQRNKEALSQRKLPEEDFIASSMLERKDLFAGTRILEIGCANGYRLNFLKHELDADVYGIDPSALAVQDGREKGLKLDIGTADNLNFADAHFDVVILGFCLYLCDRKDLFNIAAEINRVTKDKAWVIIQDFFAESEYANDYSHCNGVKSYKSDYRRLFDWHPAYSCISHKVVDHNNFREITDNKDEWIALSILRKHQAE